MSNALQAPLAVLGMACLLPGARNLEEYWSLLSQGQDATGEYPADRLNRKFYYDPRRGQLGKTYTTVGGLLSPGSLDSGGEEFDVSHRAFAEVVDQALAQAGLFRQQLRSRRVGIYVGHSGGGPELGDLVLASMVEPIAHVLGQTPAFQQLSSSQQQALRERFVEQLRGGRPRRQPGGGPHWDARWAAELVARRHLLDGPNLVVDAACASSLVALALAGLALQRGEVDLAIVGGASIAKTDSLILFSQAQSCSSDRSRPFDDHADGLVGSEGYVAMVITRADLAGDSAQAVISGIGLSSDGRGRHLWAPLREGQLSALKRAYAGQEPASIQYIEAHATSTQVGDATELESLREFFAPHLSNGKIPIGSVKSNIGHTLETAGLASLLKVVLAMQHAQMPPTINLETPNRSVDWGSLPFEVVRQPRPWPKPESGPRRAAVSAFGIGGLNVHLVVEEPDSSSSSLRPIFEGEPVAIIGRGLVVAGAHNLGEFRQRLEQGEPAISSAPSQRWPDQIGVSSSTEGGATPTSRGGYVVEHRYDYLKHRIPPKQLQRANPLQFMLLDAAEQAFQEAGAVQRDQTAVVVGTVFGSEFGNRLLLGLRYCEVRAILTELLEPAQCELLPQFEQAYFERFPALLDETGGFTSSTLASRLTKAFDLEGGALALDAGTCSSLLGLRAGTALLQGGVCSSVLCAGAQASLDLVGFEHLHQQGRFQDPEFAPGEGAAVVLLKRLADARRDGNPVLGVLLGDGCVYGDDSSSEASRQARAQAHLEDPPLASPSLTRLVGDLGAAAGLAELIAVTLKPLQHPVEIQAISQSGQACSLVVGPAAPIQGATARVLRWSAQTLQELGRGPARPQFLPGHPYRLALVAGSTAQQSQLLQLALEQMDHPSARPLLEDKGIFWGENRQPRPRLAFVFAGQGSQYPGMLRDLPSCSQAARMVLEEAEAVLAAMGLPAFTQFAWSGGERLNQDPVITQLAVLIADCMMFAALVESGLEPDVVCGHSFGEIAALVAARALSLKEALQLTRVRAQALQEASPDGGLLSVQAGPDKILPWLNGHPLYLTHRNSPQQSVIGGRNPDLDQLAELLQSKGLTTLRLRVPGALHTPLVAPAQAALRRQLESTRLLPPRHLFYSGVTQTCLADPDLIRANLVDQLVQPVDHPALIQRLLADGVGALVEVGPGQILTRLHRQIVDQAEVLCLSIDHPKRHPVEQRLRLLAALECRDLIDPALTAKRVSELVQPEALIEFDATAARRARNRAHSENAVAAPAPVSPAPQNRTVEVLLDFVVDLTGYPREAISLDWDLEADLGIDSIKRTQLIGEVGEALGVAPPQGVSLEDVSTLRQLLHFLQVAEPHPAPSAEVEPAYEQGRTRGVRERQEIRQNLRELALRKSLRPTLAPEQVLQAFPASQLEELRGVADGAGVHLGALLASLLETPHAASRQPSLRYRLAMVPLKGGSVRQPEWKGGALILGHDEQALALEAELTRQGLSVQRLDSRSSLEQLLTRVEPHPHLFLCASGPFERSSCLTTPYWICQRWLSLIKQSGRMEEASLVALTRLGGDFGLSSSSQELAGVPLSGLCKAILVENWVSGYRWLPVKVIDSPTDLSARASVEAALLELANPSYECEIGLLAGQRQVLRCFEQAAPASDPAWQPSGDWVCSGGARGITAFVGLELARRYGLRLHLLGRQPRRDFPPHWQKLWAEDSRQLKLEVLDQARQAGEVNPAGVWERTNKQLEIEASLTHFASQGVEVHYYRCDLGHREQLRETLEKIRSFGPIRGILHGAGSGRDAKFEHKEPGRVEQCFLAKVDGTLNLLELTGQDPLSHVLAFGSISGRFGANGHTDYSLANDAMAKIINCYRRQRPEVASTTIHWHAWGDVGMAVKAEAQYGLELVDIHFMPAAEGLQHLLSELLAGAPEPEVLITTADYCARFSLAESGPAEGRPLLGEAGDDEILLDPEKEVFLKEHRLDSRPMLPLVISLELLCEAALPPRPGPFSLRQVQALNGLKFASSQPVKVRVSPQPDGSLRLLSEMRARDGTLLDLSRPILEGRVYSEARLLQATPGQPEAAWLKAEYNQPHARFHHGPAFQVLRRVAVSGERAWACITAPAPAELAPGRPGPWKIPAAVLDACLVATGWLAWEEQAGINAPAGLEELLSYRAPEPREECFLQIQSQGQDRYDFQLFGREGELLLAVFGYHIHRLQAP